MKQLMQIINMTLGKVTKVLCSQKNKWMNKIDRLMMLLIFVKEGCSSVDYSKNKEK